MNGRIGVNNAIGGAMRYVKPDFTVDARLVACLGALLPGVACYMCIAYSYLFQPANVRTFLLSDCPNTTQSGIPSVSFAIGVWEPQRVFWLFVMFIHWPARMMLPLLYRRLFQESTSAFSKKPAFRHSIRVVSICLIFEAASLLAVSIFDIVIYFHFHAVLFCFWIGSFSVNIFLLTGLLYASELHLRSPLLHRIFCIKCVIFVVVVILMISSSISYLYYRSTCFALAYAAFSLPEYALVGLNSFFHFLAYFEFPSTKFAISLHGTVDILTSPNQVISAPQQKQLTC